MCRKSEAAGENKKKSGRRPKCKTAFEAGDERRLSQMEIALFYSWLATGVNIKHVISLHHLCLLA